MTAAFVALALALRPGPPPLDARAAFASTNRHPQERVLPVVSAWRLTTTRSPHSQTHSQAHPDQ